MGTPGQLGGCPCLSIQNQHVASDKDSRTTYLGKAII